MNDFLAQYGSTIDHGLIASSYALSQYVALRAGVFSLAPIGLGAVGAYAAALLAVKLGAGVIVGLSAALGVSVVASFGLGVALARLRGVFQAIATLGFVLVVQAVIINFPSLTGGVFGTNAIPKYVDSWWLLGWLALEVIILLYLGRRNVTLLFDSIRTDETAAASHGVSVYRLHMLAFVVSGAFAGVTGGLFAYYNYSVVPSVFGFSGMIDILAATVLGGLETMVGPVVGALVLTALPELARPLADNRELVMGALLIGAIIFAPHGMIRRSSIRRLRELTRKKLGFGHTDPGRIETRLPVGDKGGAGDPR